MTSIVEVVIVCWDAVFKIVSNAFFFLFFCTAATKSSLAHHAYENQKSSLADDVHNNNCHLLQFIGSRSCSGWLKQPWRPIIQPVFPVLLLVTYIIYQNVSQELFVPFKVCEGVSSSSWSLVTALCSVPTFGARVLLKWYLRGVYFFILLDWFLVWFSVGKLHR